jgi:hypothetical protein
LNSNIVDQELISQVSSFFRCHEGIEYLEFVFHNVTHQVDGSACGVHAIANAIVVCNGQMPEWHVYYRHLMREHLVSIIANGHHCALFPSETFDCKSRTSMKKAVRVFCYCREIDDGSEMIQCCRCFEWFHFKCLYDAVDKTTPFYCDYCFVRQHRPNPYQ